MTLDTHTLLTIVLTTLAGGAGVHVVANVLKRLFKLKTSSVIHTMVLALSAVGAGAQYVLQIHSSIPPIILGISGSSIYGFSQIIYRYTNYASDFLTRVRAYNVSIASSTVADAQVAAVLPSSEPAPANF